MASRWMQQKKRKQSRQRRAWAKPYSMKGTGMMANPGFINDSGEWVNLSLRSRAVAGGVNIDERLLKKFRFKPNSPEAIYTRSNGLHTDMVPGVVLSKMMQSTNNAGALQKERTYVYGVLWKEPNYEVRLYMSGNSNFIASEMINTAHERVSKISIEYESKDDAIRAWKHDAVEWFKTERVSLDKENGG